jgi:hypothetical protein
MPPRTPPRTLNRLLADVAEQLARVNALAEATSPPTPLHVLAEGTEELGRDVETLRGYLARMERER